MPRISYTGETTLVSRQYIANLARTEQLVLRFRTKQLGSIGPHKCEYNETIPNYVTLSHPLIVLNNVLIMYFHSNRLNLHYATLLCAVVHYPIRTVLQQKRQQ